MMSAEVSGLFDGAPVLVLSAVPVEAALAQMSAGEAALVARAVEKRRREFATARALAREGMRRLGVPEAEILSREDRSPIWPEGLAGSISHCDTRAAVALLRREHGTVGIDIEHREELKRDLWKSVFLAREIEALEAAYEGPLRGRMALVLFSAKEALYKAQHPWTSTFMGFHDLEVELTNEGTIRCTFQKDVGRFARGTVVAGRYRLDAFETAEVITAVRIAERL